MRAISLLLVALFIALGTGRADLPETARGLAIYKPAAFRPDSTATLLEYRSQKNHEAVTYFVTVKGRRLTVPAGKAEVLFLPYPGKGEATTAQAFALLEIARQRFPQFQVHYILYARAWREEAKRPANVIAAEVAQRRANEAAASGFAVWVKSLFPQQAPPELPQNPLGPTVLNPAPTPLPVTDETAGSETTESDGETLDLEGSLKKIQEFYRLSEQLNESP